MAEALDTWREAERLLALLPGGSSDRPDVARAIEESRHVYEALTRDVSDSRELLIVAGAAIDRTRDVLRVVRERNRTGWS